MTTNTPIPKKASANLSDIQHITNPLEEFEYSSPDVDVLGVVRLLAERSEILAQLKSLDEDISKGTGIVDVTIETHPNSKFTYDLKSDELIEQVKHNVNNHIRRRLIIKLRKMDEELTRMIFSR